MPEPPASLHGLRGEVIVHDDANALADTAAALLSTESSTACAANGRFAVALSGGTGPVATFERLTRAPYREGIDWPVWAVYFADERAVPPDDPASNYHLVHEQLTSKLPIEEERVHRMPADHADLDLAADEYAVTLRGDLPEGRERAPRLDCIVLGLGDNGHTASLFPGTPALEVRDRWVTRGRADYAPFDRLTLTYPTINAAALVVFLVSGSSKSNALRNTVRGTTPAAGVSPADGRLVWLLDAAAAGA